MSPGVRFALQLADPRGRYDRTDFLWAAITLIGAQAAFALGLLVTNASFVGWRGAVANVLFAWLAYAAISKRLHDLGRSSWWLMVAAAVWFCCAFVAVVLVTLLTGSEALETGAPGFWATFAALMLPPAGLAVWLHVAEGEPSANRYGPAPTHAEAILQPA
jgi:uncharacterized membrane protein YhaH (DUF805 family)